MPVSPPPSMTAAPAVPDRADRATLAARATAFFDYIKNNMVSEIAAAMSYVYGAATTVAGDVAAASASAADATTQAGTATTQAGVATSAAASLTSLQALWLGSAASDPATGTGGAPLVAGNAYVNTATGYLRAYNGSAWVQGVSAVSGVSTVNGASGAITGIATITGTETLTNKTLTLPAVNGYTEGTTVANSTTAYTFSLASSTVFLITLTGNVTYTFPTAAAGKSFTLYQLQDATGSRTVTWPGTVKWPAATAPTITSTASKADKFTFTCFDGTNWVGSLAGSNY